MPEFRAVVFDLFDTLVDFDPGLFPVVEINGKMERTTSRVAYDALYEEGFSLPTYEAFHVLWTETSKEVWDERGRDPELREIPSRNRFRRLVDRLVMMPPASREQAAEMAMENHMRGLIGSTVFDDGRLHILSRIREAGFSLGLLSNFDNARAAHLLLEKTGIVPFLDVALISEEEGFRKPAPCLFLRVAEKLGVTPSEVLFVGDTFEADVKGPQSVGMPCAWLNPGGKPRPDGESPPDYEIRKLEETLFILDLDPSPPSSG